MLKKILNGISAGILISIGGTIFVAVKNLGYSIIGAVLFSVALLCICYKGYSLFTGKVGYIPESHTKEDVSVLLLGLLGNAIATIGFGMLFQIVFPEYAATANAMCLSKLGQPIYSTFVRAVFCGILMYLAVSIYREKNTVVGILFCIPVFIVAGFEHSIADMFYFGLSGIYDIKGFIFIINVILGNAVGGMLLPTISGKWRKKENA